MRLQPLRFCFRLGHVVLTMLWSCAQCGIFDLVVPDGHPVHCKHSPAFLADRTLRPPAPCSFRTAPVGDMSCACGVVHECRALGKYCSDSVPVDDLVSVIGTRTLLNAKTFQHCGSCDRGALERVEKIRNIERIVSGRCITYKLDPPEVDVVIPFCAADAIYVSDAIESIFSQVNVRPWIHVVADGCQWPDLPRFPNIIRYESPGGLGPYRITNALAMYLRSDYLAIQDADDISRPDRLWRQICTLRAAEADMISGSMHQFVAADCRGIPSVEARLKSMPTLYSGMCYTANPKGAMINSVKTMTRQLFERLGGFCDWMMSADHEWDARAAAAGARLFHASDVFGLRRLHNRSLSNGIFYEGHPERLRLDSLMAEQRLAVESGADPATFGGIHCAPELQPL